MKVAEQAEKWLADAVSRNNPISRGTFATYRSIVNMHILPMLGDVEIPELSNRVMKDFVSGLVRKGLSPASIAPILGCAKSIRASVITEDGDQKYPIVWNNDFLDIPQVKPTEQDAPVISPSELQDVISRDPRGYTPLLVLLAASGLRIGEAKALKVGNSRTANSWIPERALFVIRGQITRSRIEEPKTSAGIREVDLPTALNTYLMNIYEGCAGKWMFTGRRGGRLNNVDHKELKAIGIPDCHSLRRFRLTHLENMGVPDNLSYFWTGHAKKDVHDRYVKHSKATRRDWVERAGLGFELP